MSDLPGAVLFACSENALRSPMAEALMKHLHGKRIYIDSVGVRGGDLDSFSIVVLAEIGLDLSRHHSKTFDDLPDDFYDLVITLSPEAQHRALEMTRTGAVEVEFWPTADPSVVRGNRDARLAAYREVRDALLAQILERFPLPGAVDL